MSSATTTRLVLITAGLVLTGFTPNLSAAPPDVRVLIWDEQQPEQKQGYGGKFLGETIAAALSTQPGLAIRTTTMAAPEQGLAEEELDRTDVLVMWAHTKHHDLADHRAERVVERVLAGKLSLIALHSAHWTKPYVRLMQERAKADALQTLPLAERSDVVWELLNERPIGKGIKASDPLTPRLERDGKVLRLTLPSCALAAWRADGAPGHITALSPQHPIARGLPVKWDVAHTEMYNEPYHIPVPDDVVFEERWDKGEHFRSGCVWKVGFGRVFYFRPGHETFPVYQQAEPLQVIENACRWLQPAQKLALAFPDEQIDDWHGYRRHRFTVAGCSAWVVEPKHPLPGHPWSWCMEFPDAFTPQCAATELLREGFYHVHITVGNTFGAPRALEQFDAFYDTLMAHGLGKKATLIGISRGGLYAYRWAAEHPERVAVIYGDAPVCDFKSWPAGKFSAKGSPGDWQALQKLYGFANEAEALAYTGNPVDRLAPLAKAGVALIHVVGDKDDVVPNQENTDIVQTRFQALGGEMQVIHKPEVGHHPHGLENPSPVVRFILQHTPR